MKNYLKDTIEWIAQRLVAAAIPRAVEMIEEAGGRESQMMKALPAPKLPEIELH